MAWRQKAKRMISKKPWSQPKTKIARPLKQPMRTHYFTRMASSNNGATNAFPLSVQQNSITGRPEFTTGSNSGQNLALQFRLDEVDVYLNGSVASTFAVPNYTEFTNLFDQYCIKKIDVYILPSYSNMNFTSSYAYTLPWIVHAEDNDDIASTGSQSLMQYNGAKFTQLMGQMNSLSSIPLRTITPKANSLVATSTGGTGQSIASPWINTTNVNVPHYGFKMALDDSYNGVSPGTTVFFLNIVVKYHFAFRDVI